jgi:hypothetical protein
MLLLKKIVQLIIIIILINKKNVNLINPKFKKFNLNAIKITKNLFKMLL